MTEEERREHEEQRKVRDLENSRLGKKRDSTMEQRRQVLLVDDSQLFNDDLGDIDLSHLDQDTFPDGSSPSIDDKRFESHSRKNE